LKPKKEFQENLGKNLRRIRMLRNMTLEQLALEAGMSYSQISRIELGKINTSAYTVYILSKTLLVEPADFFVPALSMIKNEISL
jgi:transcriptional regulator with XRE-family HTH domain